MARYGLGGRLGREAQGERPGHWARSVSLSLLCAARASRLQSPPTLPTPKPLADQEEEPAALLWTRRLLELVDEIELAGEIGRSQRAAAYGVTAAAARDPHVTSFAAHGGALHFAP